MMSIRSWITVGSALAALAWPAASRAQCSGDHPVDCGYGCCASAYPYCCDLLCYSFDAEEGCFLGKYPGEGHSGSPPLACEEGFEPCGAAHCAPVDAVCCANVGHEELYCGPDTACTPSGACSGGYEAGDNPTAPLITKAPYGPSLPRSCGVAAAGDAPGGPIALAAPLALLCLALRRRR